MVFITCGFSSPATKGKFYGGAVEEKLKSIYGAPAVQKFAEC